MNFDLSPLTKTGDQAFYKAIVGQYVFYVNVCGTVTDTECNKDDGGTKNVGVCQVSDTRLVLGLCITLFFEAFLSVDVFTYQ